MGTRGLCKPELGVRSSYPPPNIMNLGLTTAIRSAGYLTNTCMTLDDVFTEDELKNLDEYLSKFTTGNALLGGNLYSEDIRKSQTTMHKVNEDNKWFFDKIKSKISYINDNTYRFDLIGFDFFQYTEYDDQNSHYDWHMDMYLDSTLELHKLTRKLSISLVLSDKDEYQGGEFQVVGPSFQEPVTIEQKKNRIIAFPSFLYHKVTPVYKGKRRSIVIWVLGPKFR